MSIDFTYDTINSDVKLGISLLRIKSIVLISEDILVQNSYNYYSLIIKFVEDELYHAVGPPASEVILLDTSLLDNYVQGENVLLNYTPYYELVGIGNLVITVNDVNIPIGFNSFLFKVEQP